MISAFKHYPAIEAATPISTSTSFSFFEGMFGNFTKHNEHGEKQFEKQKIETKQQTKGSGPLSSCLRFFSFNAKQAAIEFAHLPPPPKKIRPKK